MVSETMDRWAWVALTLAPGMGWDTRRYHDLLSVVPPAELFRLPLRTLAARGDAGWAAAFSRFDWKAAAGRQGETAERHGARLLLLGDPEYPAVLRGVTVPPPWLLVKGALAREDGLAMAIVGSRHATEYGLRTADRLARDLAVRGVTIVSGLARGVDTAAHRGALDAGGRTLAVLGSGLDVVYPPENRRLAGDVAGAGAVISQFPMGTPPLAAHFPMRNRVIAALGIGTVVVEAASRSGALITARLAAELGREVYAVPGNISSGTSEGANRLIQDGAKLVGGWEDVVAEWPPAWREALKTPADRTAAAPTHPSAVDAAGEAPALGPETALLALVGSEPMAIDHVIERSGLPASRVSASLVTLELRGLVRQLPGQRYVRVEATGRVGR